MNRTRFLGQLGFAVAVFACAAGPAWMISAVGLAADTKDAAKATSASKESPAKESPAKDKEPATKEAPKGLTGLGAKDVAADHGIAEVRFINEQMQKGWKENDMVPSPMSPDHEWCRRAYLDLLGRVPSVRELRAFIADKGDRKLHLVDRLLTSDDYAEEYARNWSEIWVNLLVGRAGGTERNSMTSREGLEKYLRDSFARGKPYDKMVYELVAAEGVNVPGEEGYNGAVNFLTMKLEEKAAQATAKTAQIFLGLQVQCTQCHNHPFNDWKQQKFWDFNAFFRQTHVVKLGEKVGGRRGTQVARLVNQDFKGESNNAAEADLFYELRNGLMKVSYPAFVDGKEIARSGVVSQVNRRAELAKMMVASDYMPEAMVNRMWQHFMGHGFTKPIDDMGPHNPPTHPELLKYLGQRYRYLGFNTKELIKWIMLSEPYSLSSRYNGKNTKDDPGQGEKPKFSHYYTRQMRAEQLYESLLTATEADKGKGAAEAQEKQKAEWMKQFVVAFGNDDGVETSTFNGTIPQALMMFNGDLIRAATSLDNGSFLSKIANSNMSPDKKIEFLYEAALSRSPNSRELAAANALLTMHKGDIRGTLQDVWWAVLNSNEFILQH